MANYPTLARILLGVGVLSLLPSVEAAFAECAAGWEWSYNSKGQNPCEIAGSLQAPCLGFSAYELEPLGNSANYVTPQRDDAAHKKCECNTVIYSLYTACSVCQRAYNASVPTWPFWSQFCEAVYVTQYPFPIPFNALVPHWAYLNYYTYVAFDTTRAQVAGSFPEATPASVSATYLPDTGTGTASVLGPTANGGHGTDVGAIAGSVVGGVVGLATLAAFVTLVFIFKRRGERENTAIIILGPNPLAFNPDLNDYDYALSTFPPHVPRHGSSHLGAHTTNSDQPGRYSD